MDKTNQVIGVFILGLLIVGLIGHLEMVQERSQIEAKRERTTELTQEREGLVKQIDTQSSKEAAVHGWLTALTQKIEPAEAEMSRLDAERERLENEEATLRARLRQAESSQGQALLAQSRQQDRLERLRRQIMEDFGLVEMEPTEGLVEQPPLPLGELVSTLPVVEVLPEGLEEEIHQIKAQIRRMGLVNPDAPQDYAETLDRYTFLTSQATDLEEAARSLREVIAELDEVMRTEFGSTFKAVAARFKENFTRVNFALSAKWQRNISNHTFLGDLPPPDDVSCSKESGQEAVCRWAIWLICANN